MNHARSLWLAAGVCLALSPTAVWGFAKVTGGEPSTTKVAAPEVSALDRGGGTRVPERRMILVTEEALTLAANRVRVRIEDGVAVARVHHVLQSNVDRILQARYEMPLGPRAHMSGYAVWEKGEKLVGELLDVRRAEQLYQRVTQQSLTPRPEATQVAQEVRRVEVARDPGILRQMAPDRFETHVYPILPFSLKQVEFLYGEVIEASGGWSRWRFPLSAARAFQNPIGAVAFDVDLRDSAGVGEVECDYPGAVLTRRGNGRVQVSLRLTQHRPVGDLELRWRSGLEPLQPTLLAHRPPAGEVGYGLLRVRLPAPEVAPGGPLELRLLLDESRSVQSQKAIEQRAAIRRLLAALRPGVDRVAVWGFAAEVTALVPPQPWGVEAQAAVTAALNRPRNGIDTKLIPGLRAALGEGGPGRRLVVLASDAVTLEAAEDVLAVAPRGASILALGTGHDDDVDLLRRLVLRHGGAVWLPGLGRWTARHTPRVPSVLQSAYGQLGTRGGDPAPELTALRAGRVRVSLSDAGGDVRDVHLLATAPDVASGGVASFVFRYANSGSRPLRLDAWGDGAPLAHVATVTLPERADAPPFVASFWARAKALDLLAEHPNGASDPHRAEVVALSLAHRFVTPYTAFLSLPDAERKRMLLGAAPPDDAAALYGLSASAGGAPEAEAWILILVGLAFAVFVHRRRRTPIVGEAA